MSRMADRAAETARRLAERNARRAEQNQEAMQAVRQVQMGTSDSGTIVTPSGNPGSFDPPQPDDDGSSDQKKVMVVAFVAAIFTFLTSLVTQVPVYAGIAAAVGVYFLAKKIVERRLAKTLGYAEQASSKDSIGTGIAEESGPQDQAMGYQNFEWRYPPPGKPRLRTPEQRKRRVRLLYGSLNTVSVIFWLAVWISTPLWIWVSLGGIALTSLAIMKYVVAIMDQQDKREVRLRGIYPSLDSIMWPAPADQHISDKRLWKYAYAFPLGTHYLRFASGSSFWYLLNKKKFQLVLKAWGAAAGTVFCTDLILRSDSLNETTRSIVSWAQLLVYLVVVPALVAWTWYVMLDWRRWVYIQTDEAVVQVRRFPSGLPEMNDDVITESIPKIEGAREENHKFSSIMRCWRLVIGNEAVDPNTGEPRNAHLAFSELRYMRHAARAATLLNADIKRNEEEVRNALERRNAAEERRAAEEAERDRLKAEADEARARAQAERDARQLAINEAQLEALNESNRLRGGRQFHPQYGGSQATLPLAIIPPQQ